MILSIGDCGREYVGEWWKSDIQAVLNEFVRNGGGPKDSDAFLINGQPGDFYPCSKPGIVLFSSLKYQKFERLT